MRTIILSLAASFAIFAAPAPAASRTAPPAEGMGAVLARAAARSGQWVSAARLWRDVTVARPADPQAWAALGEALSRIGQPDDAVSALARAQQLNPRARGLAVNLGRAQLQRGNGPAAAAAFEAAVAEAPKDPAGWTGLGIARDLMGEHAAAREAYARALAIDPLNRAARHNDALSLELAAAAQPGRAP